jgi:hypothetical protein
MLNKVQLPTTKACTKVDQSSTALKPAVSVKYFMVRFALKPN